jgi:class 3 adenylate cyclase
VTDVPETHYTRSADGTNLAYQVSGEGPLDIVVAGGLGGVPVDLLWDHPGFVRLAKRLARFSRTVWYDVRGLGASEGNRQDVEVGAVFDADLIAVLDAAGVERPALVAPATMGSAAIPFSARHPERVAALVLFNSYAHYVRGEDYPWGFAREDLDRVEASIRESFGTDTWLDLAVPGGGANDRAWFARMARVGIGRDQVARGMRASFERDSRGLLPTISVPTLVLHREGDRVIRVGAGRHLAEHIPGAKFVLLPGDEHFLWFGDTDTVVDEIEEFLTGVRRGADAEIVMAAVLFTDIVGSTEQQARVGRREWSRLTDQHEASVRATLKRHRGREVKTIGDAFLATFDTTGEALRCAAEILAGAKGIGLELRAGVHTGEVEVRGDDIAGLAVTIGKRVCDLAGPGEVLVSETVRGHMVGAEVEFEDRGEHELKGVPGSWRLYRAMP